MQREQKKVKNKPIVEDLSSPKLLDKKRKPKKKIVFDANKLKGNIELFVHLNESTNMRI